MSLLGIYRYAIRTGLGRLLHRQGVNLGKLLNGLLHRAVWLLSRKQLARSQHWAKRAKQMAAQNRSGLHRVAQRCKQPTDHTRSAPAATLMRMVPMRGSILKVLLNRRVVFLGSRNVSGLKIRGKLLEVLCDQIMVLQR